MRAGGSTWRRLPTHANRPRIELRVEPGTLRALMLAPESLVINKLVGLLHSSYAPIEKMESPD